MTETFNSMSVSQQICTHLKNERFRLCHRCPITFLDSRNEKKGMFSLKSGKYRWWQKHLRALPFGNKFRLIEGQKSSFFFFKTAMLLLFLAKTLISAKTICIYFIFFTRKWKEWSRESPLKAFNSWSVSQWISSQSKDKTSSSFESGALLLFSVQIYIGVKIVDGF